MTADVLTDTPLLPDTGTGKDFVIMSRAVRARLWAGNAGVIAKRLGAAAKVTSYG